jgi:septal ring factor EnvC (AmiA/AmiB activator)
MGHAATISVLALRRLIPAQSAPDWDYEGRPGLMQALYQFRAFRSVIDARLKILQTLVMQTLHFVFVALLVMSPLTFADDKPKPEAASAEENKSAEIKSPEARIAELEVKVAKLEKELARLKGEAQKTPTAARTVPNDEDRKRYESLSEGAKTKFRDELKKIFSNTDFRNAPLSERQDKVRSVFEKIEAEDKTEKAK